MNKKIKTQLRKLKEGDIILVKWRDINDSVSWESPSYDNKIELALVATPGIFLKRDISCNRRVIRLAHSVADNADKDGIVIPEFLIDNIEVLKSFK
jgi:hypothetical protein